MRKMLLIRLIEKHLYTMLKLYALLFLHLFQVAIPVYLDNLLLEVVH